MPTQREIDRLYLFAEVPITAAAATIPTQVDSWSEAKEHFRKMLGDFTETTHEGRPAIIHGERVFLCLQGEADIEYFTQLLVNATETDPDLRRLEDQKRARLN